ncbi:MAG: alpha/beta hydrolase [Bacteroidales bacterium]|nr:alpha/beta hydrolase [Bacteroidales bacterium]
MIRVKTITLISADSLEITADEYIIAPDNPYILLFHEQGSSRGEYHTIARRLCKLDYNCLAVDIRNGGNNSHVSNETARRCRNNRCTTGINDIGQDVTAAIEYAYGKSKLPVILFGSSANGSLSLKLAVENDNVRAVVALSPGEYFMPSIKIQDTISHLKKPVFITSSKAEFPYVEELASGIEKDYVSLFEPKQGEGHRGTESLSVDYDDNTEYWVALILFFRDLM